MDPLPGLILVLDIRSFSTFGNRDMLATRELLYRIVAESFEAGGVRWNDCAREDRGDGILIVVPASVPKTTVMGPVLTELMGRVADAPATSGGISMQVRIAAHGGEIHRDVKGFAGSDVVLPFRLLASRVLRDALETSAARCVVMVSDPLYQSIVRHDYPEMSTRVFHPVEVQEKETNVRAWLHVPGRHAPRPAARRPEPGTSLPAGNHISAGGDITVKDGVLAGGDVNSPRFHRGTRWRQGEDNS